MICVSIAQVSRRLALVDMLNAARLGDLIEVRLDYFAFAADIRELLVVKHKPVIMSCRRTSDWGQWEGREDERLTLLRQCIVSKADYVEIELDVADQIRPFPPAKRVISYTNMTETPADIAAIYARAVSKQADVVKLTTLTRTPKEAWRLIQVLAKPAVPTVVVGLGKTGVMLSLLSKKRGAPWVYAALERGMESYPGQPTVTDLQEVYHLPAINASTRFVGVTGSGARLRGTIAALNAAFAQANLPVRCLPLELEEMQLIQKVIEAARLVAVLFDRKESSGVGEIATEREPTAERLGLADLLVAQGESWLAVETYVSSVIGQLEKVVQQKAPDRPLAGQMILIVGTSLLAQAFARELARKGCSLIITDANRKAPHALAKELGCRHIPFEALYTTAHDVLIVCEEEGEAGSTQGRKLAVHPGYLRPGMTIVHLTPGLHKSTLTRAAEARDCTVLTPYQCWLSHVELVARRLTGRPAPRQLLVDAAPWLLDEE